MEERNDPKSEAAELEERLRKLEQETSGLRRRLATVSDRLVQRFDHRIETLEHRNEVSAKDTVDTATEPLKQQIADGKKWFGRASFAVFLVVTTTSVIGVFFGDSWLKDKVFKQVESYVVEKGAQAELTKIFTNTLSIPLSNAVYEVRMKDVRPVEELANRLRDHIQTSTEQMEMKAVWLGIKQRELEDGQQFLKEVQRVIGLLVTAKGGDWNSYRQLKFGVFTNEVLRKFAEGSVDDVEQFFDERRSQARSTPIFYAGAGKAPIKPSVDHLLGALLNNDDAKIRASSVVLLRTFSRPYINANLSEALLGETNSLVVAEINKSLMPLFIPHYMEALNKEPVIRWRRENLGTSNLLTPFTRERLAMLRNPGVTEAERDVVQKIFAEEPDAHQFRSRLAYSYLLQGNLAKADEEMAKVPLDQVSEAKFINLLCLYSAINGKKDRAIEVANRVMELAPDEAQLMAQSLGPLGTDPAVKWPKGFKRE